MPSTASSEISGLPFSRIEASTACAMAFMPDVADSAGGSVIVSSTS